MTEFSVAYIISHYPKVSHSFIRREIQALEDRGLTIVRFAMRGWQEPLVDPSDVAERERTVFVLKAGKWSLLWAVVVAMLGSPMRFFMAIGLAVQMMRGSDRLFFWHFIYLAEACWIAARVRAHHIRHIHAHFGTNPAEVALLASVLSKTTYSFTVHGPEEFDKVFSVHLSKKVERAEFVVAISSFCRSQLYRITRHEEWTKIKVIHCGIDRAFSHLEENRPPTGNKLVCVGRLNEQKGQLLLIEAVAELVGEFPELELVLVGDGELRPAIETLVAKHNLGHAVSITGWASAEQVKGQMLDARALLLPSFAEGLPVVVMEAMAMQRPVLTTMIAGTPELVVEGETGWLFAAGSKEQIKMAVRRCLSASTDQLYTMGRAARHRVLVRHSLDRQAELLMAEFFKIHHAPRSVRGTVSEKRSAS